MGLPKRGSNGRARGSTENAILADIIAERLREEPSVLDNWFRVRF
jgi:hypothetical protein